VDRLHLLCLGGRRCGRYAIGDVVYFRNNNPRPTAKVNGDGFVEVIVALT
jgi:hypothetical protein